MIGLHRVFHRGEPLRIHQHLRVRREQARQMQQHRLDLRPLRVHGVDPELALRESRWLRVVLVERFPGIFRDPGLPFAFLRGLRLAPTGRLLGGRLFAALDGLGGQAHILRRLCGCLHDLGNLFHFRDISRKFERLNALFFRIGREQHDIARADQTGQHCQHQQHCDAAAKEILHVAHHLSFSSQKIARYVCAVSLFRPSEKRNDYTHTLAVYYSILCRFFQESAVANL